VARDRFTIRVERLDGELLVLDGLGLARGFFAGEASSEGEVAFDALAGLGNGERIELADVIAMNRTMRARSPHRVWAELIDAEAPWLSNVPADLDLLETGDRRWRADGGDQLVKEALAATIGPGRGLAVATKLLHLKRPRLFPMLDRLVAELLGAGAPDDPRADQRVETAVALTRLIRSEGRRNLEPLRGIRDALSSSDGTQRSLVRLLDAILWSAHPAAGVGRSRRTIEVRLGSG
jgi:hypothetical protein